MGSPTAQDRPQNVRWSALGAFLLGACAMAVVQAGSPHLVGNDSYYHAKMAYMLPSVGFLQEFPWLQWTIFREHFVSHHHGFHVLLMPFVWLSHLLTGDLVWGAKAATAVGMGCTFLMFHLLLRELRIPQPGWWLVLLLTLPMQFWLRLSYVRAPDAALPLMLAALLLMLRGRYLLVGVLGFIFAHVYGGVVLFPLIPTALLAGQLLCDSATRTHWRCAVAAVVGVLAGIVVNPYFPGNLRFLYTQLFQTGLGATDEVGNEWRSFDGWFLLQMSGTLAVVWLVCLVARLRRGEPIDGRSLGLLILSAAFLVLTLKARRFIEYWPIFALLNAAELGRLRFYRVRSERSSPRPHWTALLRYPVPALIVVLAVLTQLNVRLNVKPSHDIAAVRDAMHALRGTSAPGAIVFTDDWDVFPVCFYFNDHNYFVVGLDPVFTQRRYPVLWERYRLITQGNAPAVLTGEQAQGQRRRVLLEDIQTEFGASYVFVDSDHVGLYRQLAARRDRFRRIFPEPAEALNAQPPVAIFEVLESGPAGDAAGGNRPQLSD